MDMLIDEILGKVLEEIAENPRNSIDSQLVLTLTHNVRESSVVTSMHPDEIPEKELPVVTLYVGNKSAQFHGEFTQTASDNPELKPLIDYLEKNNWDYNL